MGRGDKKSKKGKRFAGSYGRVRVRKIATEKFEETLKKTTTKKKTSKKEE